MGTILQEVGHDIIITAFINSILKEKHKEGLFYLITPATGPKRDIYFFEKRKQKYISAQSISKENYIPEFYYRIRIPKKEVELLNRTSKYTKEEWYKDLSKSLGQDLRKFLFSICNRFEKYLKGDLPDILGFDRRGKLILFGEVKFEGFSKKAKESTLKEYCLAKKLKVPYYLIIPKHPVYAREITNAWLKQNLPLDIEIYKFDVSKIALLPKQREIKFIKI